MNKWQANAWQAYWRETESQAVQNKFKPEKKLNYNRYTADGWWKFLNGCNQMMWNHPMRTDANFFCLDSPGRSNDWAAQSVRMANAWHTNGSPLETANHKERFCMRGHNFIFVVFFPVTFKSCWHYCLDKNLPVFKCPDYYFFAFQTVSTLATRGVKNWLIWIAQGAGSWEEWTLLMKWQWKLFIL